MIGVLRDAIEAIEGSDSPEALRRRTLDAVEELFDADAELALPRTAKASESSEEVTVDDARAVPVAREAVRTGEPTRRSDVDGIEGRADVRSVLTAPIGDDGYLEVYDTTPAAFGEADVAALDVLSTFVADVIDGLEDRSEAGSATVEGADTGESRRSRGRDDGGGHSTLVERFPNGIVTLFDEECRYDVVGGRGFDRLEISAEDLEGQRLEDAFPPEYVTDLEPLYELALEGESSVIEQELEGRVFQIHVVPVRDERGEVIAGMTMSQDITERKAAEEELREREIHLVQAQEIANLGSWFYDLREDELDWSETCHDMFGVPTDESVEFELFLEHVHPGDRDRVVERWDAALSGEPYDVEHRIVVDGETRWVREKAEIEFDDEGEVVQAIGVVQDITEQRLWERELDAARKRYETLLQAAPDPIFVVDAETRRVTEVNEAAAELRGQTQEEIVGLHQVDLHPVEDAEAYERLFDRGVREGGTRRWLDDGSPVLAVRGNGEPVPVEISVKTIELEAGPVIYAIFRDVSEQLEYERSLTRLNEATRQLFDAQSVHEIAGQVVETATDVLEETAAGVYYFDEESSVLRPDAYAGPEELLESIGDPPVVEPGSGVVWRVFSSEEAAVYDDVRVAEDVLNPETPIRSEILVPLAGYGVLLVGTDRPAAFDERAVDLVEILGSAAKEAMKRVEREQRLKQRDFELRQYNERLERVEALNRQIRNVAQAIVRSESRTEIEEAVCAQLVEDETAVFAWVGRFDQTENALVPEARAGDGRGYVERFSFELDDEFCTEPAVEAARSRERVVVENTATDMAGASWRREAVLRNFRSAIGIPLVYQDTLQGVLTIYGVEPSAFDGPIRSVLSELGDLVAHAVVANDRKQAILTNQSTELEFDIQDQRCFFLRFTRETNCTIELEGIIPQSDESYLVFVRVQDGIPEQFVEAARRAPAVSSARVFEANDRPLVQLRFDEPFIASILADQGVVLRNISADDTACTVTVAVPPTLDVRQAVNVVTTTYPESELLAKREGAGRFDSDVGLGRRFLEKLTDRQREVVELAYLSGYFDSPKSASGKEIAEELEFSTSAFHHHVREAERKLLETVFADEVVAPPRREGDDGA